MNNPIGRIFNEKVGCAMFITRVTEAIHTTRESPFQVLGTTDYFEICIP